MVGGVPCLASAHTYLGSKFATHDAEEMAPNHKDHSHDPKAEAAVGFAVEVTRARGTGRHRGESLGTRTAKGTGIAERSTSPALPLRPCQ